MSASSPINPAESGFALVAVLWTVSILSLIAAALLASGSLATRIARSDWVRAQEEALAEAALTRAVLGLMDRRPDHRWRIDGVPNRFAFEGKSFDIRVSDELGKIDLNAADRDTFQSLFLSTGADPTLASKLADRIIDWRSEGDLRSLQGATSADYETAGHGYRPRNGPFQSVDELWLVLGMTDEIFSRVEPGLTVYSHRPMIDPQLAPKEALLAQAGMSPADADRIIADRNRTTSRSSNTAANGGSVLSPTILLAGHVFSIEIVMASDDRATRKFVIAVTTDLARPYLTLEVR